MASIKKMTVMTALTVLMLVAVYTAGAAATAPVDKQACYLQCINGFFCVCNLNDVNPRADCCAKYCDSKCSSRNDCVDVPKKPNCPPF
ncbi:hypothetical protein ABFS83_02G148700 [Erythranthe nasuta]